ncbi:MAG TPA: hypothetical protein VMU50_04505 [Polyangia bacterium]|nr:hypothetical protein [Polyangia bacterium]
MGFVLLFSLSALAGLAALAVTVRAQLRGRAEQLVAASMLWNGIIIVPIYLLGLFKQLRAPVLAVGSVVVSLATLLIAGRGYGLPRLLRSSLSMFGGLLRLYPDALVLAWRSRRFVLVGVVFAAVMLPYLALSAYLGQPMPSWDPLWYHDPIVGFTIQNHGFSMVDLPISLQKVNGYVRLGEMTQLWLVIFSDRRLGDMANLLFAPAIAAGVYVLARRYADAVLAMGWGVAVMLMPASFSILHSSYVDPQAAALLLGALVFATKSQPRVRDSWLAAFGLMMAVGSKALSLIPLPAAAAVAIFYLVRAHWPERRRAVIATIAGGGLLITAMMAFTLVRNYLAFHNPFWPDMAVDIKALHIHWPGIGPWASGPGKPGTPLNLNEPFLRLMDHLYALPWSVVGMYFDQAVDYGIGITWVAMPLGAIAFVVCLVTALRRRLGNPRAMEGPAPPVALAFILGVMVIGSPALWAPRYHTPAVGLLVTLVAWLTVRPAWERLADAAVSIVLVTSLMMFWWTPLPRRWFFTPSRLVQLMKAQPLDREINRDLGAPTIFATAQAREKELTAGKLLVFDERFASYPSVFWNNNYSNRVQFLKIGPDLLTRAAQAGATWVYMEDGDPAMAAARAANSGWQEVGILNAIRGGRAFRRIPVLPKPPPAPAGRPPAAPPPPAKPLLPPLPAKTKPLLQPGGRTIRVW